MIARITGTIVEILERALVIETGGIGYLVSTPSTVGALGNTVTLHTHLVIRDDAHELYGFETIEEKTLFSTLIGVSGVGPRTGLQMLLLYPMNDLVRAITNGDSKAISLVPGIGKKTAEKVIIDLKDKFKDFVFVDQDPKSDLVEALLSLGYKDTQVRDAITTIDPTLPLTKQIAEALRGLGK
ncbi:Holliday junction branch migration protein RuvA [Patescibacteria group bacterium]|nr:Holliday junction branch migration protein RuvA [Patescibacteria group bacterium]